VVRGAEEAAAPSTSPLAGLAAVSRRRLITTAAARTFLRAPWSKIRTLPSLLRRLRMANSSSMGQMPLCRIDYGRQVTVVGFLVAERCNKALVNPIIQRPRHVLPAAASTAGS
jgi:hypothetical protein